MPLRCAVGEIDLYRHPSWYDVLHAPGTAEEVDGLERIARRFVARDARTWLEPCCGTGRYLRVLAGRGRRVAGVDLSRPMLDYAWQRLRARGLHRRARLLRGSMLDVGRLLPPGSIDAAFNPINSIRHLRSVGDVRAHLRGVARVLAPGGAYIVGLSLSAFGRESPGEDVWVGRRGRVRQVVQYLPPARRGRPERVISHVEVRTPARTIDFSWSYDLLALDGRTWRQAVSAAGLRIAATVDENGGDAPAVEPGYALYVLAPQPG
jgi:SAM-dependent methyltransferase